MPDISKETQIPQCVQTSVSGCCGSLKTEKVYKYKGVYFKVESQAGNKRTYCLGTMYLNHDNTFLCQTGLKSIKSAKSYINEIISRASNNHLILKTISEKYIRGDYASRTTERHLYNR